MGSPSPSSSTNGDWSASAWTSASGACRSHANDAAFTEQVTEEEQIAGGLGPIDAPVLAQLPMDGALRERQAETFERIKAGF